MRFSIINQVLSWQAWKKPRYRGSIQSRHKRKSRPLFPKTTSRRAKKTRRLMKRKPYKSPEKVKSAAIHTLIQVVYTCLTLWILYEVVMASMLLE
jgi:hypothetical protein